VDDRIRSQNIGPFSKVPPKVLNTLLVLSPLVFTTVGDLCLLLPSLFIPLPTSPSLYHLVTAPVAVHSGIVISPTHSPSSHIATNSHPHHHKHTSHHILGIAQRGARNKPHSSAGVPIQHSLPPSVIPLPSPHMHLFHSLGLSLSLAITSTLSLALLPVQTPARCFLSESLFLAPMPSPRFLSYSLNYLFLW